MNSKVFLSLFLTFAAQAAPLPPELQIRDNSHFREALVQNKVSVDQWIQDLNQQGFDFLCLGESHYNNYRQFYGAQVLSKLKLDQLYLEAEPEEVEDFITKAKAGQSVQMLGAEVGDLLRQTWSNNPDISILAVDITEDEKRWVNKEQMEAQTRLLSRDGFIAYNILSQLKPGQRHAALYGSSHCAQNDLGLNGTVPFYRLLSQGPLKEQRLQSVKVFLASERSKFTAILSLMNLHRQSFVIPDTSKIDPAVYNYNWDLMAIFQNFETVIYWVDDPSVFVEEESDRN